MKKKRLSMSTPNLSPIEGDSQNAPLIPKQAREKSTKASTLASKTVPTETTSLESFSSRIAEHQLSLLPSTDEEPSHTVSSTKKEAETILHSTSPQFLEPSSPFLDSPPVDESFSQDVPTPAQTPSQETADTQVSFSPPPFSLQEKESLIRNATAIGLKLPSIPPGSSLIDHIPSQEAFLTMLAQTNSYATVQENHPALQDNPFLQQFVKLYTDTTTELRARWENSPAHATLIKCVKLSKKGFTKIFFATQEKTLDRGTSKEAFKAHIFKPPLAELNSSVLPVDRQKEKVCTYLWNSSFAPTVLLKECDVAQELEKKGVRNILHMRRVDGFDSDGSLIGTGAMSEYCQEGTLHDLLHRNPTLSPEQRRNLAIEICTALDDMHTKGQYVHGDLKCANIFIQRNTGGTLHAILADFGNSSKIHTQTGFTSTYITPEQYENALQRQYIPSLPESDTYTLGEILSNLLFSKSYLNRISFDALVHGFVMNTIPPSANPDQAQHVRNIYRNIHEQWSREPRRSRPYAELFTQVTHQAPFGEVF